jgi:hypothetical protein
MKFAYYTHVKCSQGQQRNGVLTPKRGGEVSEAAAVVMSATSKR